MYIAWVHAYVYMCMHVHVSMCICVYEYTCKCVLVNSTTPDEYLPYYILLLFCDKVYQVWLNYLPASPSDALVCVPQQD